MDWTTRVATERVFYSPPRPQTGSEVHPTSSPVATEVSFPGDKAAGTWSRPLTCN